MLDKKKSFFKKYPSQPHRRISLGTLYWEVADCKAPAKVGLEVTYYDQVTYL